MSSTLQTAPEVPPKTELIVHNNKVLVPIESELYTGWAESAEFKISTERPRFRWKGAKIPFSLWAQVVSFMRWTQEKFKEEAMVTFFYNQALRTWDAWPFPQEPNGMTIRLLPDHPLYAIDRLKFDGQWIQCGSLHHHCTSPAFQSGTDASDEMDRDGVHFTLGKLNESSLDIHVRQVFDGIQSETNVLDWIDLPEFVRQAPKYLMYDYAIHAIKSARDAEYPKEWESRIIPRPKTYNHWEQNQSFRNGTQQNFPGMGPGHTLLTKQHGNGSTDGKKNEGSASAGSASDGAKIDFGWETRNIETISNITNRLGITPAEALQMLKWDQAESWSDKQRITYNALVDEIKKTGIPALYFENLLERVVKVLL